MNFKTLLLGSAAALAVTGAQAADMPMTPDPVDYVRVCDAFGSGYWYIPGTETCIKLGGRARFEVLLHEDKAVDPAGVFSSVSVSVSVSNESVWVSSTGASAYGNGSQYGYGYGFGSFDPSVSYHSASWEFRSNGMLSTSVKSMTEYGVLNGYIELSFNQDNLKADTVHVDHVFLELGHVLMGHTDSTFNYGGGFTFDGSNHGNTETDQIRLNWAMNGFGLMLALEDPRDRWGSSIGDYEMPDIVGAITADHGTWDGKLSAGFASGEYGDAWAVQLGATFKLDSLHAGDQLRLKAGYGDTSSDWPWPLGNSFLGTLGGGSSVYFMASYKHNWSETLSSAFTYSYSDSDNSSEENEFAANLVWAPVTGFSAGAEVLYQDYSDAWSGKFRIQRTW